MIRVLIVGDHEMYRQVMTLQLETQLDIERWLEQPAPCPRRAQGGSKEWT